MCLSTEFLPLKAQGLSLFLKKVKDFLTLILEKHLVTMTIMEVSI